MKNVVRGCVGPWGEFLQNSLVKMVDLINSWGVGILTTIFQYIFMDNSPLFINFQKEVDLVQNGQPRALYFKLIML